MPADPPPGPDPEHEPHGLELLTPLADRVEILGLNEENAQMLADHLLRLPPNDRHSRFHAGMKDDAISAYVDRIDWHDFYAFGALLDGEMRAVAELFVPDDPRGADGEVAVSVEHEVQGMGLGRLLVLAAMLAARRLELKTVHLTYQPSNQGMRALTRELGAKATVEGTQIDAVISLFSKSIAENITKTPPEKDTSEQ